MTDQIEGEELDLEEEDQEQEEQEAQAEPSEEDLAAQEEARKYGWRPREEFDRDPKGWVDAKRFLELPSTDNKRLRDEIKAAQSDFEERLKRYEVSNKAMMQKALEREQEEHRREIEAIRSAQREAVENADPEAYDRLEQRREQLSRSQPTQTAVPAELAAELEAYRASEKGKWVDDPILRDVGARAITAAGLDNAPFEAQIKHAEEQVRRYFPQMFAAPEAPKPPAGPAKVDAGGMGAIRRGKGVNELPPEAKAAGREYVEAGVIGSMEEYAKSYWAQEAGQ